MRKPKKRAILVVLVGGALAAFLGHQVMLRMQAYLAELDAEIAAERAALNEARAYINENRKYIDRWREVGAFLNRPVEVEQTEFTAYLQRLETERDFVFSTLGSPVGRPMDERPRAQILRYELTFVADLEDLAVFLASLDASERLLRIERLVINRRPLQRPEYIYGARAYQMNLPTTRTEVLDVTMTIAIPAAMPAPEPLLSDNDD